MRITCNGEDADVGEGSISDLLRLRLGDPRPSGVAVAVNGDVVRRDAWPQTSLRAGDVVEIVTAVQGG